MKKVVIVLLAVLFTFALNSFSLAANWLDVKKNWNQNWDQEEKRQFKIRLGLEAADVAATGYILKNGGTEKNQLLYGSKPSIGRLLAIKTVSNFIIFNLLNYMPRGKKTTLIKAMNIIEAAVIGHNIKVAISF